MPISHPLRTSFLERVYHLRPFNVQGELPRNTPTSQKGLISCLIPSYRKDRLNDLLEDLRLQDIDANHVEIIVIDSIKEENQCIGHLRNLCISKSHGELLLFLDDDTRIFQRDFLSNALKLFQKEDFDILIPQGLPSHCHINPPNGFLKKFCFATRCCFIKRSAVLNVGGFRHLFAFEDTDLRIRLQTKKRKFLTSTTLNYHHPPFDLSCFQKNRSISTAVISLRKNYPFYFWLLIYLNQFSLIFERNRQHEVLFLISGLLTQNNPLYLSKSSLPKKIALIGPSYPLRGGIAHQTSCLYQHLKEKIPTLLIGFSKQYPLWLYPGKSNTDSSQKHDSDPNISYLLKPFNVFSWIKTVRLLKESNISEIILAWWTIFWAPAYLFIFLSMKNYPVRITIICYTALPHERTFLSKDLTRLVLSRADRILIHARHTENILRSILKSPKIVKSFLPIDNYYTQTNTTAQESRNQLGLKGKVLLFFGYIRPYKGLEFLLKSIPAVLKNEEITLIIAGEAWEDITPYQELAQELNINHALRWANHYIPSTEVPLYFLAADLIVFPYLSAQGSGVLEIAQGFNLPVVATKTGSFIDMINDGENGYLVDPGNEDQLAQAIITALDPAFKETVARSLEETKKNHSWERLVDTLIQ